MNGAGKSQPSFFAAEFKARDFFDHCFERLIGNQTRRSATEAPLPLFRRDRRPGRRAFSASASIGGRDVAVVRANDNDVVRIVRHGRAKCAALQTKPAHKSDADIAGGAMTLDHDQFQNIARRCRRRSRHRSIFGVSSAVLVTIWCGTISITLIFAAPFAVHDKIFRRAIAKIHRAARLRHRFGDFGPT